MAFFEPPERKPARLRQRRRKRHDEPWERPRLLVPGYLSRDLVLAVSDEAAVIAHGIACFPTGFSFTLATVGRYWQGDDEEFDRHVEISPFGYGRRREVPDTLLRFGVAYSNGGKATTLEGSDFAHPHHDDGGDAGRPHIVMEGGGGGGLDLEYGLWVSPLPPAGPVTFACEWPAFGVPETLRKVEGQRFRRAAEKARPIFSA